MKSYLKNPALRVLIALVAIYIIHFSVVSCLKYKYFIYDDFDLAVHSQALWNTVHGSTESSILGKSFLGNHAHFILFLILPIFFLFPAPLTLLILQSIFLGLGAIVVFLIAKSMLDDSWALLLGFIYLIYPGLIFANLYEFHPTAFAVLFLLLMIYFHIRKSFLLMLLFSFLALLCQENISLIISAFFLYLACTKGFAGKRGTLIILSLTSFLWFLFCVYAVMPFFAKERIMYFQMFYSHVGTSPGQILAFMIIHPIKALHILLGGGNLRYLYELFGPLSFLPLAGGAFLFAILPALLQHLLSLRRPEQTIYYHYVLEMIPFIFAAAILAVARLKNLNWFSARQHFIRTIVFIIAIFFYLNSETYYYLFGLANYKNNYYGQRQKLISSIPKDVPVIATFCFQPKLSMRKYLYSFHSVLLSRQPYSKKAFNLPENTQFALIDFTDRLSFYDFYMRGSEKRIQDFLAGSGWGIQDIEDSTVLFKKGLNNSNYLYKELAVNEAPQIPLDINVDNAIKLYGLNLKNSNSGNSISFELFWQAIKNVDNDIAMFFDFVDSNGKICARIFRPICYRVLPTYTWQKSLRIREYRNIVFPPSLAKGKYTIKAGFYYYGTDLGLPLQSSKLNIDKDGRFNMAAIDVK